MEFVFPRDSNGCPVVVSLLAAMLDGLFTVFSFMQRYNYKRPIRGKEMVFMLCSMRFPIQKL